MTKRRAGFTIVELTIVLGFLSVLLIAILILTLTAGKLYVKGDTNRSINQLGRDVSDTMKRDFLSANIGTISPVITQNGGSTTTPLNSGRICLGYVTYLWNTAALLNDSSSGGAAVRITMGSSQVPIHFIRIVRPNTKYCDKDTSGNYPINIPSTEAATELISGSGRDFALYDVTIQKIAQLSGRGMFEIKYTLGTNEKDTTSSGAGFVQCIPGTTATADFNYCSVHDFDMIVRTGGTQ